MKKLFIILLVIATFCSCFKGPMGEQGIQGEKGEEGEALVISWEHVVKAEECTYDSDMGCYLVFLEDERFEYNCFYQLWADVEDSFQANLEMYYSGIPGKFYYLKVVTDGVMLFTADEDITGRNLLIMKIEI